MTKFKYDHLRYNRYYVLKPNLLLLLIIAYLLKDIFIGLIVAASLVKARGGDVGALVSISSPRMMFGGIPIVALFYALLNRTPDAGRRIRWIWRNGKHMILASVLANSVLILLSRAQLDSLAGMALVSFLFINIACVIYVYRSEIVSDVFAEFPSPREKLDKGRSA
jgi:hypothetical protein